jgi:hypothetical protein
MHGGLALCQKSDYVDLCSESATARQPRKEHSAPGVKYSRGFGLDRQLEMSLSDISAR